MQRFVKGRTNNHLTWVMVDATDFATPESNCSNITTIKIYGKLRGGTGTNFVSSGTGSLTNDITHVGASATGTYTIALAKADLSDASAAWYDQYVIHLSATGSARQTLVVDGGIDESTMLVLSDAVSNVYSAATQINSRVLLAQSSASDAASAAQQANSRALVIQSQVSSVSAMVSDVQSYLVGVSAHLSNVESQLAAHDATLSDFKSDFQSRVPKAVATASVLSDLFSDFQSRVPKAVATNSQLSDLHSDLRSLLVGISGSLSDVQSVVAGNSGILSDVYSNLAAGVAISASDMSDIRSAITANGVLRAGADPGGVVAAAGTLAAKVDWLTALSRNKLTQDATSMVVHGDGGAAIAEASVSDDGTTFTRNEFA